MSSQNTTFLALTSPKSISVDGIERNDFIAGRQTHRGTKVIPQKVVHHRSAGGKSSVESATV